MISERPGTPGNSTTTTNKSNFTANSTTTAEAIGTERDTGTGEAEVEICNPETATKRGGGRTGTRHTMEQN